MLEFIDSEANVLALRIGGRIENSELNTIMDRLEPMLEGPDNVHIYVEVGELTGIALEGLPGYTARALPLFGKLKSFDRVAVVADQAWIRVGAQIESMLLPFVSYRTYELKDRNEALDWVRHGEPATV